MFNKEQQKGAIVNEVNYLDQSPWENLIDIQCGDIYPKTVSEAELKQILLDCLVENNCSYSFLCIADLFTYISDMELAIETYKKSEALLKEPADYSDLARSIIEYLHDTIWHDKTMSRARLLASSVTFV